MPIEIPMTKTAAKAESPRRLVIYSPPKMGKTSIVAGLENCLLLDLEDGSDHVTALKVKATNYQEIIEICDDHVKKGRPYKYIAVDTTTALEDMCLSLALRLYQQTPMGREYKGHILSLPNGAGYLYLRNAFTMLLDKIQKSFDRVILLGHIKDKFIEKAGKEVNAKDIDLTGKLKSIVCSSADAIAYLSREGTKTTLSFKSSDEIVCGARPAHLRNQEFVIAEEKEFRIETYWDKIYID
jgi:hypothetical protein